MLTIKSLNTLSTDNLYITFSRAFADYERSWTREEFEKMLHRRSFDPTLSFGAFDDDTLVAFTFNGIGHFNGVNTAYDTGTGTIKEYRGQGLAGKIFDASIPHLTKAGISQYLLEVLQHNTTAIKIYSDMGFSVTRELNYFVQQKNNVRTRAGTLNEKFQLKELKTFLPDQMEIMWEFIPAWQNTMNAIERKLDDFKMIGAFTGDQLVGYGIIEFSSGDLPQLAVHQDHRRLGIGSAIFNSLLNHNQAEVVRIINTEVSCESITQFLAANNIQVTGKQFEMALTF